MKTHTEIPNWVTQYNDAGHQSSAGKAVKILFDKVKTLQQEKQEYADQQLAEYKAKLKEVINKANYLGQVSKNNIVNTIDTTVI